jgi:AraC family transcriptional regulator
MAPKDRTLSGCGRRVARAMALIARDPAATPRLEDLAAAAAFSPHDLHRICRAPGGETLAGTLARPCGHGSAAALRRAFGRPPAAWLTELMAPLRPRAAGQGSG